MPTRSDGPDVDLSAKLRALAAVFEDAKSPPVTYTTQELAAYVREAADRLEAHDAELLRVAERAWNLGWSASGNHKLSPSGAQRREDVDALLSEREES